PTNRNRSPLGDREGSIENAVRSRHLTERDLHFEAVFSRAHNATHGRRLLGGLHRYAVASWTSSCFRAGEASVPRRAASWTTPAIAAESTWAAVLRQAKLRAGSLAEISAS